MRTLRLLGGIGPVTQDGTDVEALLRQPKRIALLAYLALPRPGTWHRRDTIIALFWPELDQERGRTSLRNALYVIRQHVDPGAIRTRGDDDIALDADLIATDVAAMEAAAAAGCQDEALARYTGELLPGLFVSGADEFDQWLDGERGRVLALARRSAALLTEQREQAGDVRGAIEAATRATELNPLDEGSTRRDHGGRWVSVPVEKAGVTAAIPPHMA